MRPAALVRRACLLAAAAWSLWGLCGPVGAQSPRPEVDAARTPPAGLPRDLPLRRDQGQSADAAPWTAGLVLALLAVGGGVLVLRRRGAAVLPAHWRAAKTAGPPITKLGSLALTPQASVHAVRWNGEEVLLGCTAAQVTLLARRPGAVQQEEDA